MTFSEKLYSLRKEKHLSQEALAEKLHTTRQAVSKWETGQGFPETEKLLMISNLFEVSVDFLLKDNQNITSREEKGLYVSKEMAENYLTQEMVSAKNYALGISMAVLSIIPYLLFKETALWIFLTSLLAVLGIGILIFTGFKEDEQYASLKKEPLIFDPTYLKELTTKYHHVKEKSIPIFILGISSIFLGALPFLFVRKKIIPALTLEPFCPLLVLFIATGIYLLVRSAARLESYEILVNNQKYAQSLTRKLQKKLQKKLDSME